MVKKIASTFILVMCAVASFAQPKFASKVQKAIVSVNTYDKQGNLLHSGTGFYVGQNGEALASFSIFKGAYKATVIDASGKQAAVDCILGADDTYSLVRFRVSTKGNAVLNTVQSAQSKGTTVYAVGYSNSGPAPSDVSAVSDTAMINGKYVYYALGKAMDEKLTGAPVFNADGVLMGILHSPIGGKSHVLDVRFREQLVIAAIPTGSSGRALNNTFIYKDIPETVEEALVYAYMKSRSADNDEYMDLINRFVAAYPRNAEGYLRRSTPLIDLKRFDEAEADMQKYLSLVEDKASGYYNVSTTIYDKLTLQPEPAYDKWNFDVALDYVNKALELNDSKSTGTEEKAANDTKYKIHKAKILSSKKEYDGAISLYEALYDKDPSVLSYLYAISLAREGRGDSAAAVIEPLDSAISKMGEPLPAEASNYVIRRGQLLANTGKYREAVQDYNQYCYLMNNRCSAVFYYERSQIEVNARMYQQAVDDINKAVELAPRVPLYHVDKASLAIRVGMLDDCITACETAIALNPAIVDSYRMLGYAQLQKGDKESARANLQKAIGMGDENAKAIMEKYFK